jgi:hypothetical protein
LALGSHPYVLENGPELPEIPGPHADVGGEVLEGMYAEGCTSLRDARITTHTEQLGSPFPSDNEEINTKIQEGQEAGNRMGGGVRGY